MSAFYEQGQYRVRVTSQTLTETKTTGNPQFVLGFELLGMVDPRFPESDLTPVEPGERSIYRVITEKTVDYLMEDIQHLCEKAGIPAYLPGFEFLDENTQDHLDLRGTEFDAYCKHEAYGEDTKERWSISRPRQAATPVANDKVRKLNALFGKQLKSLTRGSATPQPQRPPQQRETVPMDNTSPEDDGEDIPF